jgi:mRNA-degrading endonuclease toxin of MazEF toxin-antitoxin module
LGGRQEAGLPRESVALCHQITTLDRSKLTEWIGVLSPDALARIEVGIKAATGLI